MAIRLILGVVVALVVLAMTGVLSFLSPVAEGIYLAAYGHPMPHRGGGAADQVNDWLSFLPADPTTRGLIVCGTIVVILALFFFGGLVTMKLKRMGRARQARRDARTRAMDSYHVTR
ncbi:MAG: hypothetical protein ACRDG4_17285 [Chloroflexota bacterium]